MDAPRLKQLDETLGRLWSSRVDKFTVDAWRCRLFMNLTSTEFGKDTLFELIFSRVSGFSFLHNIENYSATGHSSERFEFLGEDEVEPSDYTELTSVHYRSTPSYQVVWNHLTAKNPLVVSFRPNFLLEMWSSLLLIEAMDVTINKETFEVGRSEA